MTGERTCGEPGPHSMHRYDEEWVDGVLLAWHTCPGVGGEGG